MELHHGPSWVSGLLTAELGSSQPHYYVKFIIINLDQSKSLPSCLPPPPNPVLFLWRILSLYYFLIFDIARFFYFFQVFLHFLRPSLFHMTFGVSFSIPQKGPRDFNQKCTQITDSGELKFHKTESDLQTSF